MFQFAQLRTHYVCEPVEQLRTSLKKAINNRRANAHAPSNMLTYCDYAQLPVQSVSTVALPQTLPTSVKYQKNNKLCTSN